MTDDLYERYKEALRTGHVGVLKGSLDEALAAYRMAAEIAPSRALPHTSLGGVYMRLGHLEDALTEFAAAVARAPHDEGALLGQAEALSAAGMRSDAAAALDHVAEIQEAAGRLPEAADTLRRAVELDEASDRIRRQRILLREIRLSAGDHAAERLLARALRLRDEPAADALLPSAGTTYMASLGAGEEQRGSPSYEFARPPVEAQPFEAPTPESAPEAAFAAASSEPESLEAEAALAGPESEPEPAMAEPALAEPEPVAAVVEPQPRPVLAAPEPEPVALEREPVAVASFVDFPSVRSGERPPVGVMAGVDGPRIVAGLVDETDGRSGDELLAAAEAADQAGNDDSLRSLLLWTARAYAREGRFEAGLDATHRLLQRSPSDVDAHLVLVELYVARGWDGLAADKLRLLGRLAELNHDEETRRRLCDAATRAFPQDPTLEHLCA